ncbi:hypothetical protein SBA1_1460010 [Candidatus Sulfotelmatobacter kueseliae]|uniref:Uncharacterized protein n=1 Tax=Candidatus Sulfotelmatobacter kueseliae TaxID=2042962 RepID=A0A2U3K8A4_9BACT|nr:hypothetical protein SBA1_1460010 [Candidatus Sulfotelmatobacter kueseliae]
MHSTSDVLCCGKYSIARRRLGPDMEKGGGAAGGGPEEALTMAVAAGASSVEAADASSGVRSVAELRARISSGWERIGTCVPGDGWTYDQHLGVWNRAAGGM